MMKFFRKRQKELLAVAMAGLLIIWLGGEAFTSMFNVSQAGDLVAQTAYGKITIGDQTVANGMTDLISRIGSDWTYPLGRQGAPITLNDWIVLGREAERLGIRPDRASVRQALIGDNGDALLVQRARELDVRVDDIVTAHARLMAIQQTAALVGTGALPSEAILRMAARDVLEKVRVRIVTLPAAALTDDDASFTDEEIATQYDAYRTSQRGAGLDFGYILPPALKVEYIKINRDTIVDHLRVPDAVLEKQARDYWEDHKEDFDFERPEEADDDDETSGDDDDDAQDTDDEAGDDGATDSGETDEAESDDEQEELDDDADTDSPSSEFYQTWEEARQTALAIARRQRADRQAQRTVEWLAMQLRQPWYVTTGDDGYKAAPEVVQTADYLTGLVSLVPAKHRYPEAMTVVTTDFFSEEKADNVRGIGLASKRSARGWDSLRSLAFNVQGLAVIPSRDGVDRSKYISLYQPSSTILADADKNLYLFRVVQTRLSQPPESLDEVRDSVIADLRRLRAFDAAKLRAEELVQQSRDVGLDQAFEGSEDLADLADAGVELNEPLPFARMAQYFLRLGMTYAPNMFLPGTGLSVSSDVGEQIFALGEADSPIGVFPLEKDEKVLVIEWLETLPAQEDEYTALREGALKDLAYVLSNRAVREWLQPEKLRARNGVEAAR